MQNQKNHNYTKTNKKALALGQEDTIGNKPKD